MKHLNYFLLTIGIFSCAAIASAQCDSILYHDTKMESQWGSSTSNDHFGCFVRFTPPYYPAQLCGVRAYFRNADASSTCKWTVFSDPSGAAAGGVTQVLWSTVPFNNPSAGGVADSAYSIYKDLTSNAIIANSGDLYVGILQHTGWAGTAVDNAPEDSAAPNRQWTYLFATWTQLSNQATSGQFGITGFFMHATSSEPVTENDIIDVYPNPASNLVHVMIPAHRNDTEIKLFDCLGKCIISENALNEDSQINISSLNPGIYVLEINTGKNIDVRKLVKN